MSRSYKVRTRPSFYPSESTPDSSFPLMSALGVRFPTPETFYAWIESWIQTISFRHAKASFLVERVKVSRFVPSSPDAFGS